MSRPYVAFMLVILGLNMNTVIMGLQENTPWLSFVGLFGVTVGAVWASQELNKQ